MALDAVTSCRPTTPAGLFALARYVIEHERRPSAEDDRSWQGLGTAACALAVMVPAAPAAAGAQEGGRSRSRPLAARAVPALEGQERAHRRGLGLPSRRGSEPAV